MKYLISVLLIGFVGIVLCYAPIHLTAPNQNAAVVKAYEILKSSPYPAYNLGVYVPSATMSMWPELDQGCYIVVIVTPFSLVQVGDSIGFNRAAKGFITPIWACHEVIAKTASGACITKGKNNIYQDSGFITARDYQFTVYAVVRFAVIPYSPSLTVAQLAEKLKRERVGSNQAK